MTQQNRFRSRIFIRLIVVCSLSYLVFLVFHSHFSDGGLKRAGSTILTNLSSQTWEFADISSLDLKPRFVEKYNGIWQRVHRDVDIYLFSAFYDDRPGFRETPMIRTIAVVRNGSNDKLSCLLWFGNNELPEVTNVTVLPVGTWFQPQAGVSRAVILSCAVQAESGRPALIPKHVSIVTATQTAAKTLLRVQVPEKPKRPMAFGHCMSVAYWYHDPYRVVEWMELHRMWGVEEVTIYNSSLHPATARVYRHYADKGFVDLRQAPCAFAAHPSDEEAILLNISPVLNDCMYRNMYRYRRLVVTDIDEMIVPRIHANYTAMLEAIDAVYVNYVLERFATRNRTNATRPSQVKKRDTNATILAQSPPLLSYIFNNVFFFSDLNATTRVPRYLATQQYRRHIKPSHTAYSVKSIQNPRFCVGLQNHFCLISHTVNGRKPVNVFAPRAIGMNYHYKKCHFDSYLKKPGYCKELMKNFTVDLTMTRFRRVLESRVLVVLKELDLIEPK